VFSVVLLVVHPSIGGLYIPSYFCASDILGKMPEPFGIGKLGRNC
jgi:hypothetical protein